MESARRRDRGDVGATTTTLAILTPVIVLMITAVVQGATYYHGLQRAGAAADRAVAAASVEGGTAEAGREAANAFLDRAPLDEAAVTVDRGPENTTAIVTGVAPQLIPGITWRVTVEAEGPTSRFIPEPDRR